MGFHPGSDTFHGRLGAKYEGDMFWVRLYQIWVRPHLIVLHVVAVVEGHPNIPTVIQQRYRKGGNVANNDVLHDLRVKIV